jgi:hypothetical protein
MFSRTELNPSHASDGVARKCRVGVAARFVILSCAFAVPLCSQAQEDPCEAAILAPPAPAAPTDKPVCPAPAPDNVADGTKAALACAWIENPPHPDGTDHVLEAFRLLISDRDVSLKINQKVLVELHAASPENDDLFRAALGNPDGYGPTAQGVPDFVDTISKANTRGKVATKDEIDYHHQLFACTKYILDQLFAKSGGKIALVKINDAFSQKNNYVAMYQLLDVVWAQDGATYDAEHLEKLRAAFAASADDLTKQIAAKVAPTSK